MQKCGVITFSYAGFDHFDRDMARHGHFTANLGDNAQSIAARSIFQRLGHGENIVSVDRDTLPQYAGPPVRLLMNAVFRPTCFPLPPTVTPIYLGFNARNETLPLISPHLKAFEPIGCRDPATAQTLNALGVEAYVSGCVTLTLAKRPATPRNGVTHFVYGAGKGELPISLLNRAPVHVADGAVMIFNRIPVFERPINPLQQQRLEQYEEHILRRLKNRASLVVTSLHHIAAPCMAMGIPTIICRKNTDSRFGLLSELTPIYTPDLFEKIDWEPTPVNVEAVADAYQQRLEAAISLTDLN